MRLINTETFKLENFSDVEAPPYAILSHTWGTDSEELAFSDVQKDINKMTDEQKKVKRLGLAKFKACCEQARADKIGYAWIDTCCIDKSNMVELGEAINSMFRWYSLSAVCYAYLFDVPDGDDPSVSESEFQNSRWFKRGWTLQELLAPKDLRFYNSEWHFVGTKKTKSIIIRNITRIPRHFLLGLTELYAASVAQRMSWAAQRETKRDEDLAYCLLGIFGIAMPMIYGEGGKAAFFRLQEQIMKTTRDDSILAWDLKNESSMSNPQQSLDGDTLIYGDILASSPSKFANSWQITTREQATNPLHSLDIFGGSLRIYLPILATDETFGLLSCGPKSDTQQVVAIPLAKISSVVANEYVRPRESSSVLLPIPDSGVSPELIHIKKDGQRDISTETQNYLFCEEHLFAKIGLDIIEVVPEACWDKERALISQTNNSSVADQILIRVRQSKKKSLDFAIVIDFHGPDSRIDLLCCVFTCDRETALEEIAANFQREVLEALRQTSASNAFLHLNIALEPVERNITSITPKAMNCPPTYTINATMALNHPKLVLEPIRLLWAKKQNDVEMENLNAQIVDRFHLRYNMKERWEEEKGSHLGRIEESRQRLKEDFNLDFIEERQRKEKEIYLRYYKEEQRSQFDSIAFSEEGSRENIAFDKEKCMAIEEKKNFDMKFFDTEYWERKNKIFEQVVLEKSVFNREIIREIEEMEHIETEYAKIRERQDKILKQVVQAQKRLKQVYRTGVRRQDGWTPFHSAMAIGDIATMDLLFDESTDIMAEDEGWIAASRNGDVEQIRGLLATDRPGLDHKDGIFGRTPLSWASMNGHIDVVNRLLKTKKADIRSKDNHGRTPLRWALERGHHDIVRLLLGHWDMPAPVSLQFWGDSRKIPLVAFSHDSALLASGSSEGIISLWDSKTGSRLPELRGHERSITSVAFSHDSKYLASGSDDSTIRLWDIQAGKCIRTLQGHKDPVYSMAFSHDAKLVAAGSRYDIIKLWDSQTGECIRTLERAPKYRDYEGSVRSAIFSHDSELVASSSDDETVVLWARKTGLCLRQIETHGTVRSLCFLYNSKILASLPSNGITELWDSKTGERIHAFGDRGLSIHSVALSHDLKLVALGSSDGTIKLWDSKTHKSIHNLHLTGGGHAYKDVHSPYIHFNSERLVASSHDLKTLAFALPNGTLELWDASIIHDLINSTKYPDSL